MIRLIFVFCTQQTIAQIAFIITHLLNRDSHPTLSPSKYRTCFPPPTPHTHIIYRDIVSRGFECLLVWFVVVCKIHPCLTLHICHACANPSLIIGAHTFNTIYVGGLCWCGGDIARCFWVGSVWPPNWGCLTSAMAHHNQTHTHTH